jgi:tRNA(His) 5'-end guanylyltransferase
MKKDSIGNRMKENYENRYRLQLTRRIPVIIRLDGKAFHTFTKGLEKPFDITLHRTMVETTKFLIEQIQGAQLAYTQSDEISILVTDYDYFETEAWFDYNIQKLTSVSASLATGFFNWKSSFGKIGYFDSRVFNIPKEEVMNYFLWRFQDWKRNSIQLLGQSLFSHKELHKKNQHEIIEMCKTKGHDWNSLPDVWRYGTLIEPNGYEFNIDFSDISQRVHIENMCVYTEKN